MDLGAALGWLPRECCGPAFVSPPCSLGVDSGDVFPCRTNPFSIEKAGKRVFLFRCPEQKAAEQAGLAISCPAGWPRRCRHFFRVFEETEEPRDTRQANSMWFSLYLWCLTRTL